MKRGRTEAYSLLSANKTAQMRFRLQNDEKNGVIAPRKPVKKCGPFAAEGFANEKDRREETVECPFFSLPKLFRRAVILFFLL